ncbi:MAG: hypothetical protein V4472_23125 [Pseudomonadota bacterium]
MLTYEQYKSDISRESSIQNQWLKRIKSLGISKSELKVVTLLGATKITVSLDEFDRIKAKGRTAEEIAEEAFEQIRTSTVSLIRFYNEKITEYLENNENRYAIALKQYKHLPIVTYKAKSAIEIENIRINSQQNILRLVQAGPFHKLDYEAWAGLTNQCGESADSLKNLASELSKERADWQKYADDARRLQLAFWALALSFLGLVISQAPAWYKIFTSDKDTHGLSLDCTQLTPRTFKCIGLNEKK